MRMPNAKMATFCDSFVFRLLIRINIFASGDNQSVRRGGGTRAGAAAAATASYELHDCPACPADGHMM